MVPEDATTVDIGGSSGVADEEGSPCSARGRVCVIISGSRSVRTAERGTPTISPGGELTPWSADWAEAGGGRDPEGRGDFVGKLDIPDSAEDERTELERAGVLPRRAFGAFTSRGVAEGFPGREPAAAVRPRVRRRWGSVTDDMGK